jgi:RNA polymerase sigma factor (sigma-70 family)
MLPAVGSADYWRLIEAADAHPPLPLELLARCLHERHAAAANEDADRIFTVLLRRIQSQTQQWAWAIARQARAGMAPQLREDLEQEAYLKLWEELTDEGPTYLFESFPTAYMRLRQHVAQRLMEKAGERQRPGAETPTRIPRAQTESLQRQLAGADDVALGDRLADTAAQADYDRAELSDLLKAVEELPLEERTLILDRYWDGVSQEETAEKLGISPRMVRYRLKVILRKLRIRYHGDEEDNHG